MYLAKKLNLSINHIFFVTIIIVSLFYNYNKILFYEPIGIHQWRNTVSAAFAYNAYAENAFIKTTTNGLLTDDKTSDVTIVEFPIIYSFVGLLYKIFSPEEFIFRLVNVLIGFLGLFALFKTCNFYLKNTFYALSIPLIIFSSPIFVFYLNNFIPDATAISIVFIALFYFIKYRSESKPNYWFASMALIALAGLIKTASLIFYFSLGFLIVLSLLNKKTYSLNIFPFKPKYYLSFVLVFILIIAWYAFAKIYSDIHRGSVSAVEIRPIWLLSSEAITETLESMNRWFKDGSYHSAKLLLFALALMLINLIFLKRHDKLISLLSILSVLGGVAFTLFFFRSMRQHDYYQINNLLTLAFIFLNFFLMLKRNWPSVYDSLITKIVLGIALVLLITDCRNNINKRYSHRDYHYKWSSKNIKMFGNLTPHLRNMGIVREDIFYCSPDPSFNISLYLLDQKGFTDFGGLKGRTFEEKFEEMKSKGLQYIIIGDTAEFSSRNQVEFFKTNLGDKIGQFGETLIYAVP